VAKLAAQVGDRVGVVALDQGGDAVLGQALLAMAACLAGQGELHPVDGAGALQRAVDAHRILLASGRHQQGLDMAAQVGLDRRLPTALRPRARRRPRGAPAAAGPARARAGCRGWPRAAWRAAPGRGPRRSATAASPRAGAAWPASAAGWGGWARVAEEGL